MFVHPRILIYSSAIYFYSYRVFFFFCLLRGFYLLLSLFMFCLESITETNDCELCVWGRREGENHIKIRKLQVESVFHIFFFFSGLAGAAFCFAWHFLNSPRVKTQIFLNLLDLLGYVDHGYATSSSPSLFFYFFLFFVNLMGQQIHHNNIITPPLSSILWGGFPSSSFT